MATAVLNEDAALTEGTGPFADVPEMEPRTLWIPPKRGYLKRSVDEAIEWAWGQAKDPTQDWTGLCQSFCRQSYGVGPWAGSAIKAWQRIGKANKVIGGKPEDAPRGALLYYSGGQSGHVARTGRREGRASSACSPRPPRNTPTDRRRRSPGRTARRAGAGRQRLHR